jgi:two-component system response regulator BaeR
MIDEQIRLVTVNGVSINLTPSEFGLLTVLAGHPERVFSRSELLNRIQGYHFDGYDRTIDSHIKNLRKKMTEAYPGKELIITIYGVGYKLSV